MAHVFPSRFEARSAIVVGGASGLGFATAKRIVEEGGRVAIWDIGSANLCKSASDVGAMYSRAVDISDYSAVSAAAKETKEALGTIDILINSAGVTGATSPVIAFPTDSWLRTIDVNLNGLFYCCREIAPLMIAREYGRIVNISSVAGKEGNPNASAYSASKAAVIGFTKSLGKELATRGVLVNCVTPATFDSAILAQLPQSQIDYMCSKIPMGRIGNISENAALVCWLASEECSFSTAATFDISGGRTTY